MRTLYRIFYRTPQGKDLHSNDLFDRATAARRVRELNERYSRRGVEYVAEAVEVASLSRWQLTNLFLEDRVSYEELLKFAGFQVAEQAMQQKIKVEAPMKMAGLFQDEDRKFKLMLNR